MAEPEQQAFSIYELICTTSADRPIAFRSTEQAHRETAAWQATNPGLQAMRDAPPDVLLAFLRNYKDWRTATDRRDDHKMSLSMGEAVHIAIGDCAKAFAARSCAAIAAQLRQWLELDAVWLSSAPVSGLADARRDVG
jgi:hypothetical protein